jgi:NitT/TauT family transport system substrate-binding protein
MKRSRIGSLLTAAVLIVLAGCSSHAGSGGGDKITFMLDTNLLPKHAIFFAGLGKGFYAEEGLNIDILPGTGSKDTSVAVGTGRAQFGFADFGAMAKARIEGANVKQIGLIHAASPFAVVVKADSGIRTWQDLKGKKVAGEAGGSTTILFPLALKLAGIPENDVKVVVADGKAKVPGLLAGQWDGTLAYFVSDPPVLISQGVEPFSLKWADVGFKLYSNGLIASDETISKNPDLVKRFVRATSRSVKWACDNYDEAAKIMTQQVPEIGLKGARAGVEAACGVLWIPETTENGLGYMTEAGVQNVIDITKEYLGLKSDSMKPADLYSNDFLSGIKPNDRITPAS